MGNLLNKAMKIEAIRHFAYYQRVNVSSDEAVNPPFCKIILLQRLWVQHTTVLALITHNFFNSLMAMDSVMLSGFLGELPKPLVFVHYPNITGDDAFA